MSYDFTDSGLETPVKMEPCHRCGNKDSRDLVVGLMTDIRTGYKAPEGEEEEAFIRMCPHCGYMVPMSEGCDSPEEAAIRWNGDQVVQQRRIKTEEARQTLELAKARSSN